jgi:hypothetical protein
VIQSEQTFPSRLSLPHVEIAVILFCMFSGVLQAACHGGAGSDVLSQFNLELRGFIGPLLVLQEVAAEWWAHSQINRGLQISVSVMHSTLHITMLQ